MDMQDCYAWVVALSLVAFLLGYLIRLGDREDDLKHQKHYMSGVVLVEYSHEGKPIKCFVQQDGTYTTNNPVRTIIIASRYDDALIAKTAKML
ncbi:MAG: hypothetical protein KGH64_06165, partial [Candidatus Micrarchaeota archaeon]|nr:hypothetical protein [Candidatus Micrarchaeota archaeon]